jgi:hypothetical protein
VGGHLRGLRRIVRRETGGSACLCCGGSVGEVVAAVRRAEATRWRGVSANIVFEGGGVGEGFEPEVPSRAVGVGPVCL